ncbi:MAG: tripartite tricarboxylate transporter substrate-binding protein, partial [Hydrogenophaga sp.]|nr:tripartite tricarboxylate transporter substrate-binding protein [Hydrogenophaga sp.]
TPVASAARVSVFLMARNNLDVANVKDFIAYVKARPGRLTYGSAGNGSSPHLAGEMFKSQAGLFAVHVPYRGAAPALNDLLGGQIDFHFDPGIGLQHAKAGRLKLLAVGSSKRSPLFPDVPTLAESGLPGFDADSVFGFYAPAATPPAVVARVNAEVNKILAAPAVRERLVAIGAEALPLSPAEFGKRGMDDSQRFGAIIRERKITAD